MRLHASVLKWCVPDVSRAELAAAEQAAQQKAVSRAKQLAEAHARAKVALHQAERLAGGSGAELSTRRRPS